MYRREEYTQHYHKGSNIETAYSMIKGKFGSALRSKSDTGQINEALCKVLAHNVCVLVKAIHMLGIEPVFFAPMRPKQVTLIVAKMYASRLLGGGHFPNMLSLPAALRFAEAASG